MMSLRTTAITTLAMVTFVAAHAPLSLHAQATSQRPHPYPVSEASDFQQAVEQGTRTRTGEPGPQYWQQRATYTINARLNPATRMLSATQTVRYTNNSPDQLDSVVFNVVQDVYKPGSLRNRNFSITRGTTFSSVKANGVPLGPGRAKPGYTVANTIMWIHLPAPLAPGATASFEMAWSFEVPRLPSPRMGYDGMVYFIAYWYPQLAVYDDVQGWNVDPYMGSSEFYMGYGDYSVSLTIPEGWLVAATGELTNPQAVLSQQTRDRLAQAKTTREIVNVVTRDDRKAGVSTTRSDTGWLTWNFSANNVRDFAFGTSDLYVWDATHAVVNENADKPSKTVAINTLYRPDTVTWRESAKYARHGIEYLSKYFWPYPYPQMSATEGIAGGMEFPMITAVTNRRDSVAIHGTIFHEIVHQWFPMMVGSNERRWFWMDEGITEFTETQGAKDYFPGFAAESLTVDVYLKFAKTGHEVETMRPADDYPVNTFSVVSASYYKPAAVYRMLREMVGDTAFINAFRTYGQRWAFKHPQPNDLFNSINQSTGKNLDWFWRTWFFETWTLDQAIGQVERDGDTLRVTIEDRGLAPMPVWLVVTRSDGSTERVEVSVDTWLAGATNTQLALPGASTITRLEIDPEQIMADLDRSNNVWVP